jgi:hypothetical protein
MPYRPALLAALYLATGSLALALWPAHITVPVKVGQEEVDKTRLPFACITIGTVGGGAPIERVVIENVDSHASLAAQMGTSFKKDRPDYPYGGDEKGRVLAMVILELPPGRYRLRSVEFTPEGSGISWLTFTLPSDGPYCFTVHPGCVNYVGSVIFAVKPRRSIAREARSGSTSTTRVAAQTAVERTAGRDQRWASKLIPCMAPLPSQESPFGPN